MSDSTDLAIRESVHLVTPCTVTAVSLAFPDDTPRAAWIRTGAQVMVVGNWSQWAWADWLREGLRLYGEEAWQYVPEEAPAHHTLQNLLWVGDRFPPERRRGLPFTFAHHAEVAALSNADEWLDWCAEQDPFPTRAQLRSALRAAKRAQVAEANGCEVIPLPSPVKGRGLVEVNGGLAYVGMTAMGDLLANLEGYVVEYEFRVVAEEVDGE